MDCCPKCKSDKGYFFKNTGSFKEMHGFNMGTYSDALIVSREGRNAYCSNCQGRIKELDKPKRKKSEYFKVIADGKEQGIVLKSHKQKIGSLKNLSGIKLVDATPEDIAKYEGE